VKLTVAAQAPAGAMISPPTRIATNQKVFLRFIRLPGSHVIRFYETKAQLTYFIVPIKSPSVFIVNQWIPDFFFQNPDSPPRLHHELMRTPLTEIMQQPWPLRFQNGFLNNIMEIQLVI
jgi:hypothetical protein